MKTARTYKRPFAELPVQTPSLFPRPRLLKLTQGPAPAADVSFTAVQDAALSAQGYRLAYTAAGIELSFADAAGLRYGLQTLDQLRAQPLSEQVAVQIEDWPDFAHRGFMLDVSRDRVPTRAGLARLIDVLALARINQLEIYTEHAFAYRNHQTVWRDASPLTAEDVRWLDDLCTAHGIELVPNQNTFGHWERWLAHEEYLSRAENPAGMDIGDQFQPPSTLAPTPDNAEFVTGLLEELTPNFRSRRLNIGADETWELGTGISKERAEKEGLGTVYLDYVAQVMKPWVDRGYTVEFWADILGKYPELMGRIPAGTIPVVWHYDSPSLVRDTIAKMSDVEWDQLAAHGFGPSNLTIDFADRAKTLVAAGEPFWVAPGTSTWLSILGRLDNAIENMIDAAEVGLAHGSKGYLNTAWGDNGMYDPPVIAYAPVLYGGAVSWSLASNRDIDLACVLTERVFADEGGVLGRVLVELGGVTAQLDVPMLNASPLFLVLLNAGIMAPRRYPAPEALAAVRATLENALVELGGARPATADGTSIVAEISQAIRLSLFAVGLLENRLLTRAPNVDDVPHARRLLRELDALLKAQREAWILSSRSGGLDASIGLLDPLRHALIARAEY